MALRKAAEDEGKPADVDITSLIDMTFLLLIYLISIRQVAVAELAAALTLPVASQANPELQRDRDRLIVNVDKDGDIYVARTRFSMDDLGKVLHREATRESDEEGFAKRPVFIRADANLAFGVVQDVMLKCREARIWKLTLRTMEPPPGTRRLENTP